MRNRRGFEERLAMELIDTFVTEAVRLRSVILYIKWQRRTVPLPITVGNFILK